MAGCRALCRRRGRTTRAVRTLCEGRARRNERCDERRDQKRGKEPSSPSSHRVDRYLRLEAAVNKGQVLRTDISVAGICF